MSVLHSLILRSEFVIPHYVISGLIPGKGNRCYRLQNIQTGTVFGVKRPGRDVDQSYTTGVKDAFISRTGVALPLFHSQMGPCHGASV